MDDVGYHAVHRRLRYQAGPARTFLCADCGAQADEWSFIGCADALVDLTYELEYCTHLEHYLPRCKACHFVHDERVFGPGIGSAHHNAKLTEAAVISIRARLDAGIALRSDLAAEYGVSVAAITDVALRRTWTHLD